MSARIVAVLSVLLLATACAPPRERRRHHREYEDDEPALVTATPAAQPSASAAAPSGSAIDAFGTRPPLPRPPTGNVAVIPPGPVAHGPYTPEIIDRAIRGRMAGIRTCYDTQLKRVPTLKGTITLTLDVNAKGVVRSSAARSSSGFQGMGSCILKAINGVKFPPHGTPKIEVDYPLAFEPNAAHVMNVEGKALADVTVEDVVTALQGTGCRDVVELPKAAGSPTAETNLLARCNGREVALVFVPSRAVPMVPAERVSLLATHAMVEEGAFLLAVRVEADATLAEARRLLERVVRR